MVRIYDPGVLRVEAFVPESLAGHLRPGAKLEARVDALDTTVGVVVDELVPKVLTLGQVQAVLSNLLREQVSIRNLAVILETLADAGRHEAISITIEP